MLLMKTLRTVKLILKVWDLHASLTKGGLYMLDFTWKVFSETGNIDTYLLFKELQVEKQEVTELVEEELAKVDFPIL